MTPKQVDTVMQEEEEEEEKEEGHRQITLLVKRTTGKGDTVNANIKLWEMQTLERVNLIVI